LRRYSRHGNGDFDVTLQPIQALDKLAVAACSASVAMLLPCIVSAQPVAETSLALTYLDSMRAGSRPSSPSNVGANGVARIAVSTPQSTSAFELAAWSNARLVEVPRNDPPGTYSRPHYALGFRSEPMRLWLNGLGVDATACLAPVVRLRTKISSGGHIGGTLWLSARCDIR